MHHKNLKILYEFEVRITDWGSFPLWRDEKMDEEKFL